MLVIHFSHLCKLYWWFMMNVNYHQQAPPHLGFYSSSIKGWITQDITLGQVINIKLFLVMHALRIQSVYHETLGDWRMEQLEINHHLPSVKSIGEAFYNFWKQKHSLPSPFCGTLKSLCICGIFGSSPRHWWLCLLFTYF